MLLVLVAAGCIISGVLIWMGSGTPGSEAVFGANLCRSDGSVNCHYVLGSRWARLGSVPAAVVGFIYYVVLAVWFVFIGVPNRGGRGWHVVPMVLTALGLCGSFWFIYVMAVKLPVWCTWCVAAHVVNGLVFLLTALAWPRGPHGGSDRPYPSGLRVGVVSGTSGAAVVITFLAGLAYAYAVSSHRLGQKYLEVTNNIEYIAWRHSQSPMHDIPIRPDDAAVGEADAPFTIVVFSDFECGKCANFHRNIHRLVTRFPGTLRCVFKHYPMSIQCNEHIERGFHYFACEAALAAEAARAAGTARQLHKYHHLLYENRSRFDERPYESLAEEVEIDAEAFSTVIASDEIRRRVLDDIDLGKRLGIEGTPTLFLNGRSLPDWKIMKNELPRRMDVSQSLALWERLLGTKAVTGQSKQSGADPERSN